MRERGYGLLAAWYLVLVLPLGSGDGAYEALAPYADACWAHRQPGSGFDVAVILLPTDRSFVACHPDASMGASDTCTHTCFATAS